jgi:small-conductance mechanosensitive channel
MTLEIIVFILAILFGIVVYWRESKNNSVYRFFNKLTHAKKLQMQPGETKGFLHQQNFLIRLVWVTLFFVIGAAFVSFVTPINIFFIQYFASAIVGTLIGTYIASFFIIAREKTKKENMIITLEKGKDYIEELSEDIQEKFDIDEQPEPEKLENKVEEKPKKSARDRLKDKGMIN